MLPQPMGVCGIAVSLLCQVFGVHCTPDGSTVVASSEDRKVIAWTKRSGTYEIEEQFDGGSRALSTQVCRTLNHGILPTLELLSNHISDFSGWTHHYWGL